MSEMQKFKTNINCSGCVENVKPFLDHVEGIENWEVDTNSPDKILKIKGNVSSSIIIEKVKEAGFNIEKIKEGFFKF